jgi:hypothetical protein
MSLNICCIDLSWVVDLVNGQILADFIIEHQIDIEHDLVVVSFFLLHGNYILTDQLVVMGKA